VGLLRSGGQDLNLRPSGYERRGPVSGYTSMRLDATVELFLGITANRAIARNSPNRNPQPETRIGVFPCGT
jgi:hypothetical protein